MQTLINVVKALLYPKPDLTYTQLSVLVKQNCGKEFCFLVAGEAEAQREARSFRTSDNKMVCIESASGSECHYRWDRNQSNVWCQTDPNKRDFVCTWPAQAKP